MNLSSLPLKPCKASTASSTDLLHMVQRTITLRSSYSSSSVHSHLCRSLLHHPTAIFFIPWTFISQMTNHFLIYKNSALLVQFRKKKKGGRGKWIYNYFFMEQNLGFAFLSIDILLCQGWEGKNGISIHFCMQT